MKTSPSPLRFACLGLLFAVTPLPAQKPESTESKIPRTVDALLQASPAGEWFAYEELETEMPILSDWPGHLSQEEFDQAVKTILAMKPSPGRELLYCALLPRLLKENLAETLDTMRAAKGFTPDVAARRAYQWAAALDLEALKAWETQTKPVLNDIERELFDFALSDLETNPMAPREITPAKPLGDKQHPSTLEQIPGDSWEARTLLTACPEKTLAALAQLWMTRHDSADGTLPPSAQVPMVEIQRAWAYQNPATLIEWLLKQEDSAPLRMSGLLGAYRVWAMTDPKAALAHAKEHTEKNGGEAKSLALIGVVSGWGSKDKAAAHAYLDDNAEEVFGESSFLDTLFALMAIPDLLFMDAKESLDLAFSFKNERCRETCLSLAPEININYDPMATLKNIVDRPPFPEKEGLLVDMGYTMPTAEEPASIAALFASVPEGYVAIGSFFGNWLADDQATALAWLDKQEKAPALDHAYGSAFLALLETEPDRAKTYLKAIEGAELRKEMQGHVEQEPEPEPEPEPGQ